MSIYAIADTETAKLITDALDDSINVCNDCIYDITANIKVYDNEYDHKQLNKFKTKRKKLMDIRDNILKSI